MSCSTMSRFIIDLPLVIYCGRCAKCVGGRVIIDLLLVICCVL